LKNKQSFVLDGTFSKYEKAADNIKRSLEKSRPVFIFYVYQKPEIAWKFTLAREKDEGRNIPKDAFITQFLGARDVITKIFNDFEEKVNIFLVRKDFEDMSLEKIYRINKGKAQIDRFIPEVYTKEKLEKII